MNHSTPGLPVHRQLLEFTQTHVYRVDDAIHLCCPLLPLTPIPPSIRVFSNESTLCIRWPRYWSFSLSISPSNEHPGMISFKMGWLDLQMALTVKNSPVNAVDISDVCSIPGSGRSPGGRNGNPRQYSCLENPRDRGA